VSEATKTAQHGLSEHSHGFGVPIQTRSERPKSTKLADFEEISTREEQWRYISADRLGGLDKGSLDEFSGDIEAKLADGVESSWVDSEHKLFGSAGIPEDRVAAAGWEAAKAANGSYFVPERFELWGKPKKLPSPEISSQRLKEIWQMSEELSGVKFTLPRNFDDE
jgi:hypothetical protein